MNATSKTYELLYRLEKSGIQASFEQAETLRRAELTLQHWAEKECGTGNDYNSWNITRDEETGTPYMEVHPNTGKSYRYKIADKEKGALKRVQSVCNELGIYYFHQTDPRGCALYVAKEPLPANNYTRGISCCN